MRRTDSMGWGRAFGCAVWTLAAIFLAAFLPMLAAAPAAAVQANFDSTGVGFVPSTDLLSLPSGTIDLSDPVLNAGDTFRGSSFDVDFTGSGPGEVCILVGTSDTCQADLATVTTAYSVIVTLEISAINTLQISGPFTLALTMLQLNNPLNGDVFTPAEVEVRLDPTAPMPLNTSAVPGFNFDGMFDEIVRIEDQACTNSGGNCNYLGWTVSGVLDTVTLRFDVLTPPNGRDTPALLFNAIPVVVPEPGTALLMGLGLAGLSLAGRRSSRGQD